MSIVLECGNVDSCEPGTTHRYPDIGDVVLLREGALLRMTGSMINHTVQEGGQMAVVDGLIPDAHQAQVLLFGFLFHADVNDDIVWLDVPTAPIEPTTLICPMTVESGANPATHHLIPKAQRMTCRWCGKTEKQIRDDEAARRG